VGGVATTRARPKLSQMTVGSRDPPTLVWTSVGRCSPHQLRSSARTCAIVSECRQSAVTLHLQATRVDTTRPEKTVDFIENSGTYRPRSRPAWVL
jgi:hypothetical protein